MKHRLLRLLAALATLLAAAPAAAGIAASKHNLSVGGPGSIKAASDARICVFCHTPHNASPIAPLWNRKGASATYTPYSSSTAKAGTGQPSGASLLCLSCHDGTTALGDTLGGSIAMAGGVTTLPAGNSRLGTDLSDDHPISIAYTAALAAARGGELADPATLTGKVRLDAAGRLQCTSCHDAHDDSNGKFLVLANTASALCQTCHLKKYWSASSHKLSTKTWNGSGTDPWPHTGGTTVAANACENCHRPHSAGGKKWLMNAAKEEDNCYSCHNGNVAAKNLVPEFAKASAHAQATSTGVHDAAEAAVATTRHAECVDCHNPHAAKSSGSPLAGSLTGVRGVAIGGGEINPATAEYQICFRCHADSPGKPAAVVPRQIVQTNTRLEFQTGNPSYHPVAGPGKSSSVPSLKAPWTTASTIKCSDCHNNNAGPGAGGTGPNGPHGSTYDPLLERNYVTTYPYTESASAYALCYKCHDRNILLNSGTAVASRVHRLHVVSEKAPCSVCHDAHGISASQGHPTYNKRLLNWDTRHVKPDSSGRLRWEPTTPGHGRCYMNCHENHAPYSY